MIFNRKNFILMILLIILNSGLIFSGHSQSGSQIYYKKSQSNRGAFNLFKDYSIALFLGSHFLENESFVSLGINFDYLIGKEQQVGADFNTYLDRGQTNLALHYNYDYTDNIYIKSGLGLHYASSDWALLEKFEYPDHKRNYQLDNSFFSSFFIEPGLIFSRGKLEIKQSVIASFALVSGDVKGIAYTLQPTIKILYRLF
jgi:hypothetical protein